MGQDTRKKASSFSSSTRTTKKQRTTNGTNQRKLDLFFTKPSQPATIVCDDSILTPASTTTTETESTVTTVTDSTSPSPSTVSKTPAPPVIDSHSRVVDTPQPTTAEPTTATPFFENSMYTDQVHHMLDTVLEGESFLFTKDDLQRFERFKQLPLESQHLLVRLWMRKQRRWLRVNKLDYSSNIRDMDQAVLELANCSMVHSTDNTDNSIVMDATTSVFTWSGILDFLTADELKEFTLVYQCPPKEGKLKSDYVDALTIAREQTMGLASLHDQTRTDTFMDKAKELCGTCILLDETYATLFHRLNIVYFRLSDPTEGNSMRTAILAKLDRRHYPDYIYYRTSNVWTSIEELDQYEKAFQLQYEFETKLESIPFERRKKQQQQSTDSPNGTSQNNMNKDADIQLWERQLWTECWVMCENILGLWEELLQQRPADKDNMGDDHRGYYMRRFEAGYIYTHMLEHGTKALGKLQEYSLEALVLEKLIGQRIYRQGKRGKWYDRLALIQSNYLKDIPERQRKKLALQTCINGIQDPRVHQTHMNVIQRRIQRLERDLCIPRREQHDFSYLTLKKPTEKIIHAERISDTITGKKSTWRGDDGAEISVEEVSIQYYNKQGYQGLHTENGVITMLFMLLFWDIIFSPVPGAFETPYQTAPLDLWSDAFYVERIGVINERLDLIGQIDSSTYLDIIRKVDDEQRALQTLCAGVNWNYGQVHLLEIAECMGPQALSSLCRLLAEEFGHRQGGMPDLCCWNYDEKRCLFVEVKGPGDKLSETQKVWLDTLSNMGIPTEVCYVKIWTGEDELLKNS